MGETRTPVALVAPCYMDALRPSDVHHARRVLEALGEDVDLIRGRCCGQPGYNSGFRDEARTVGREFLRSVQPYTAAILPSGSCTAMVQHYLPGLFEGPRREAASHIAHRVSDFATYVAAHPRLPELKLRLRGIVTYHDACHGRRELGLTEPTLALLTRVDGLEIRRLQFEEECCGFGGTFSAKLPEVSAVMGKAKLSDIAGTGAKVVVSGDLSCMAHLESLSRVKGEALEYWTVAEVLAKALPA